MDKSFEQEGRIIESSFTAHRGIGNSLQNQTSSVDPILDPNELAKNFEKSSLRLLVLDYDGTLTPLVDDPEAAVPNEILLDLLETLTRDMKTEVWLVSGRNQAFLDKHFGRLKNLGLAAEHGCFVRYPDEEWIDFLDILDTNWMEIIAQPLFEQLTSELPGSEVECKKTAIVWHYRNADQVLGLEKAKEMQICLQERLQTFEVDVVLGSNILEAKPQSINKGTLLSVLMERRFPDLDKAFIFCAGDDTTDEDMFRILREGKWLTAYSCLVSDVPKRTLAQYRISTPYEVRYILRRFIFQTEDSWFLLV